MVVKQKVTKATKVKAAPAQLLAAEKSIEVPASASVWDMIGTAFNEVSAHARQPKAKAQSMAMRSIVIDAYERGGEAVVKVRSTSADGTEIARKITRRA